MRHCAMFRQAKAMQPRITWAASRVLVAAALVAGLAMSMMLATGAAQACAAGNKSSSSVSIVQRTEWTLTVVSAVSAPAFAIDVSQDHKRCCGGIHSQGADCVSACCSVFSAAINGAIAGLVFAASIRHSLPWQDGLNATRPPPDFRPPRTFA